MTHNDSHLMELIDELKSSRNVMDQREVKTLHVIEGLLKRIEALENKPKTIEEKIQDPAWVAKQRQRWEQWQWANRYKR